MVGGTRLGPSTASALATSSIRVYVKGRIAQACSICVLAPLMAASPASPYQGYDSEATTMGTSDAVLTTIRCSPCLSTSKNFSHCNAERCRLHTLNRGAHTQQSP